MTKAVSGLRELEKRLKDEPDNLGLRVTVAGALHEAGRREEAVELYRSVAIAYRDQGRGQQAIAVCRSILEIAPDDTRCHALLAALVAGHKGRASHDTAQLLAARELAVEPAVPAPPVVPREASGPTRRSSLDETPLPRPLPYHVHDPTTKSQKKLSESDLPGRFQDPVAEGAETRPGSEEGATRPDHTGIANAARRISASLIRASDDESSYDSIDLSAELDTRQRPRIESSELHKISRPPPTAPVERVDFDEAPTAPPVIVPADGVPDRDREDELTTPRELPEATWTRGNPAGASQPRSPGGRGAEALESTEPAAGPVAGTTASLLGSAFFAPLPPARRDAVLSRFHRRSVAANTTVIRQGETEHSLIVIGRGRLDVKVERPDGKLVLVTSIGAGEYIGEAALLARAPAPAHIVAATDSELMMLLPNDFYEVARAFPALWAELKNVAERRTREHQAKLKRSS